MLETAKQQIIMELYHVCVQNGIDPEELDVEDPGKHPKYAEMVELSADKPGQPTELAVKKIGALCESYFSVQSKIDSI